MFRFSSSAGRAAAGALAGACAWPVLGASMRLFPTPLRFFLGWFLFTLGPGFAVAGPLTRDEDALRRLIVLLGVGSAAAPAAIDVLGRLHLVPVFPYLALAMAGAGLASWRLRFSGGRLPTGELAA